MQTMENRINRQFISIISHMPYACKKVLRGDEQFSRWPFGP
jgi:hypothetical protein